MNDRLNRLKQYRCDDIDALAEQMQDQDRALEDPISTFSNEMKASLKVDVGDSILRTLDPVELLSDFKLVTTLRDRYDIIDYDPARFATKTPVISKVNHGFWEHLAFLHTRPERRDSYRNVGLDLRTKQYLSSDFLPVLLGAWMAMEQDEEVGGFVSTTTGVVNFADNLGQAWTDPESLEDPAYELKNFRRGAARGLLAFADIVRHSAPKTGKLRFYDSVAINTGFQTGALMRGIAGAAGADTVALVMGPQRLGQVRIANWPGPQAFLGISLHSAMAQWQFNLRNLVAVLEQYAERGQDVVVFFQGAVLGPILAAYLRRLQSTLPVNVGFVDLGRLMDLTFEEDITKTGSPLPDGSFNSRGQLVRGEAMETIFAETAG